MMNIYGAFLNLLISGGRHGSHVTRWEFEILHILAPNIVASMRRLDCPVCGRHFRYSTVLISHLKSPVSRCSGPMKELFLKLHWLKNRIREYIIVAPTYYKCRICNHRTLTRSAIIKHMLDNHSSKLQPFYDLVTRCLLQNFGIEDKLPDGTRIVIKHVKIE